MADSTDEGLDALLNAVTSGTQYANASATTGNANAAVQAAYAAIIKNLKDRFADYGNLKNPDYKDIAPQQLGSSALSSIPTDARSEVDQQQAIAQLQDIADKGGLSLADQKALNDIQGNLNRNNSARQQSTANSFASRGQLGSGAQLAMDLANQQNAAQQANNAGESAAAQAQQRAMQAILQKAQAGRTMANDKYSREAQAAQAADSISRYNAAARTDASKYNDSLKGQGFADSLAKLQGQSNLTGSLNTALLGSGQQNANTTLAQGALNNGLITGLAKDGSKALKGIFDSSGDGGGSTSNPTTQAAADAAFDADTSEPATSTIDSTANAGDGFDPSFLDDTDALEGFA